MTKSAYARARGKGASWVTYMINAGRLAAPALLPDGRIDPDLADQMLADRCDPARGNRKPSPTPQQQLDRAGRGRLVPRAAAPALPDPAELDDLAQAQPAEPVGGEVVEFSAWRTRRERAETEIREINLAKLRGELVEVAQLRRTAIELAGLVRQALSDRVEAMAAQARDAVSLDDAVELLQQADRELCQALATAARALAEGQPHA